MRTFTWQAAIVLTMWASVAAAQSPGVLYTFAGTGNTQGWMSDGSQQVNQVVITNTIDGQLTFTETGDPILGDPGGTIVIRDGHNIRRESSPATGGLDVTGLSFFEIDVEHNGAGDVNVQFYTQSTPGFTYLGAGSNGPTGVLGGPDYTLGPGIHTLQFPISALTAAQQAYVRTVGLNIRSHDSLGNLTWTVYELRTVGTPLTLRDLVTHDVGSSDNGLQGAFANFDLGAIVGNNNSQNQTGLSHNPSGSGSLQWTDRGGDGTEELPSGAAIGWGNGTVYNGNTFNERVTDLSNYTHVTYRISATDALAAGGLLGVQAYIQGGDFVYQSAGELALPIDGEFHDLTFSLAGITDLQNVQFSGVNLFAHENDLVINVDRIRYEMIEGLAGDYNGDGFVDAADYTVWRNNLGEDPSALASGSRDPLKMGPIDGDDYTFWKSNYGNGVIGSGGLASTSAVPEPTGLVLLMSVVVGCVIGTRRF